MERDCVCEHFRNFKLTKSVNLEESSACRYCMIGRTHLWMCLAKGCGVFLCDRNSQEHMKLHLEQFRSKKAFHSIFLNVLTARIVCVHCQIEILDVDQIKNSQGVPDPYPLRVKILPGLLELDKQKNKIMGQLQNSEGHQKISRALTGFFSNKYTHVLNSAIQFLMQFDLFRDLVLTLRPETKEMEALQSIFKQAEDAGYRAIHTDELTNLLFHEKPHLLGYSRRDPFEHVLLLMTRLHEQIKSYSLDNPDDSGLCDEWDILGRAPHSPAINLNCPLFDALSFALSFNYECTKCKIQQSAKSFYNFLKVSFPRKKRKVKEVEKELAAHNYDSPVKNRRKSLMNLFKAQEECPFTLAQLIIEFLKHPFHKDRNCAGCRDKMEKRKIHFATLPEYLLIQVNRMGMDGNSIQTTALEFSLDDIEMGTFTAEKNDALYSLETVLGIENGCLYPVISKSKFNRQAYIFKGELVTLLRAEKNNPNPYLFLYKRKRSEAEASKMKDYYNNVRSNVETASEMAEQEMLLPLPDFWLNQIKFGIGRPLNHQMICKHSLRKPRLIRSKMNCEHLVPTQVYEFLVEEFTGKLFKNKECEECVTTLQILQKRKRREKEKIMEYEKQKASCHCMVSNVWLKKWIDFLYKKGEFAYFYQGHPFPGPIDNKVLLDGQKCRPNLQKNVDYKVVNIFIWRLLKDIYGGGPEIRYKWNKNQITEQEEILMKEVRASAKEIKDLYVQEVPDSSKRSVIIERTTSYVESVRESSGDDEPNVSSPSEPNVSSPSEPPSPTKKMPCEQISPSRMMGSLATQRDKMNQRKRFAEEGGRQGRKEEEEAGGG